jgi:hypothetical protein
MENSQEIRDLIHTSAQKCRALEEAYIDLSLERSPENIKKFRLSLEESKDAIAAIQKHFNIVSFIENFYYSCLWETLNHSSTSLDINLVMHFCT